MLCASFLIVQFCSPFHFHHGVAETKAILYINSQGAVRRGSFDIRLLFSVSTGLNRPFDIISPADRKRSRHQTTKTDIHGGQKERPGSQPGPIHGAETTGTNRWCIRPYIEYSCANKLGGGGHLQPARSHTTSFSRSNTTFSSDRNHGHCMKIYNGPSKRTERDGVIQKLPFGS